MSVSGAYPSHLGSSCHTVDFQGNKTLEVRITPNLTWVFPWSLLVSAEYLKESDGETLLIVFSSATVTIEGSVLGPLLEVTTKLSLASVCVTPAELRVPVRDNRPCITRIAVRATHDSTRG